MCDAAALYGRVRARPLLRSACRAQLLAEIKIHRCLSHRYIVGFESFFEDKQNVYIMLELCASQVRERACACAPRRLPSERSGARRRCRGF